MESPEMANMRNAQEYNTAEKHLHQRIDSIHLMAEMFNCSTDDVEIMLSLLRIHGVYEICEAVEDFTDGTPLKWSFGTVVTAAEYVTLKELYGKIDDDLHRKLSTVTVSTQPTIYGTVIGGGEGLDEKILMAFSDMIKYGVNMERIKALNRAYESTGA